MDVGVIGWDVMDWIDVVQGRNRLRALVNKITSFRIP
jgi:hypothetical protein